MGEKYDERPHRNTVYFAIGDRENPYNWSVVSLARLSVLTSLPMILILSHYLETQNLHILH